MKNGRDLSAAQYSKNAKITVKYKTKQIKTQVFLKKFSKTTGPLHSPTG